MKKMHLVNYFILFIVIVSHYSLPVYGQTKQNKSAVKYYLDKANLTEKFQSYSLFNPSVPVYKIANGRIIHRFFDTNPISPSGRYVALFRMPYENAEPKAGDAGEIIIVDLKKGTEKKVAVSYGWETQMGANVQWGATDTDLFFNDVDTKSWKTFAVKLNILTGERKKMSGTVFMVSPDGKKLASYNLISSRRAQGGYGVVFPDSLTPKNIGISKTDGIFITDIATNQTKLLVSIADIYERTIPSIKIDNPENFEFYCFQVKWNPQCTRLLTTIQWTLKTGGKRRRAVITMNGDGTDIRTAITPDQWAKGGHHINWHPDGEYVTMNLNIEGDKEIEIIKAKYEGSDLHTIFNIGSGHPSVNKAFNNYAITDSYYDEKVAFGDGTVPLRLINLKEKKEWQIVRVPVVNTMSVFRVDLHPAWDKSGKYVVFNGNVEGTRNVFIADLRKIIK
jgi:hypothetical protein